MLKNHLLHCLRGAEAYKEKYDSEPLPLEAQVIIVSR